MKICVLTAIILLCISTVAVAANIPADAITGVWQTEQGGYIHIYNADDGYAGRVVGSVSGKAEYDDHNPDPEKRGRRLLGVTIFAGLHYKGNGEWDDGTVYDPRNGKTYSLKMTLHGTDKLDVRGYVGFSLFGKSQTWVPVPDGAPHLHKDLLVDK